MMIKLFLAGPIGILVLVGNDFWLGFIGFVFMIECGIGLMDLVLFSRE